MSIADLRKDYSRATLTEEEVNPDPTVQFATWFRQAMEAGIPEANAMSVATVGADGRPSSRILLIKEFNRDGFTWFTNYRSRKGRDLEAHPYAALLFHWVELERQVRIEGRVEKLMPEQNDAYFHSRPLNSRLGALASDQSETIASREMLEQRFAQAEASHGDQPVRPSHWGGYRLIPDRIEFWQGRPSRLHDRIVYTRQQDGAWRRERLQP
jgi:pyridoxamine 5'-phosphate oxidase